MLSFFCCFSVDSMKGNHRAFDACSLAFIPYHFVDVISKRRWYKEYIFCVYIDFKPIHTENRSFTSLYVRWNNKGRSTLWCEQRRRWRERKKNHLIRFHWNFCGAKRQFKALSIVARHTTLLDERHSLNVRNS